MKARIDLLGKLDCLCSKKKCTPLKNGRFFTSFRGGPILSIPLLFLTFSTFWSLGCHWQIILLFPGSSWSGKTVSRRATRASWTWRRRRCRSSRRRRPTSSPRCPTAPSTSAPPSPAWPPPTRPSSATPPRPSRSARTPRPCWPSSARPRWCQASTRTTCPRCCPSRLPTLRPTRLPRTPPRCTTTSASAAPWHQCRLSCITLFTTRYKFLALAWTRSGVSGAALQNKGDLISQPF